MLASGLVTEGNVLIGSELPPTPRIACLSVGGSLYSLSLSKWLPNNPSIHITILITHEPT